MTRATAAVAALIIAGRPPTMAMVTAMVKEANSPIEGSTPAMMENEIASGISARATTKPARTSVRKTFGAGQDARAERSRASGETAEKVKINLVVFEARTCARPPRMRPGGEPKTVGGGQPQRITAGRSSDRSRDLEGPEWIHRRANPTVT
jgi:hypothetical protein